MNSLQELYQAFNDPKNWKPTANKQYNVYVAKIDNNGNFVIYGDDFCEDKGFPNNYKGRLNIEQLLADGYTRKTDINTLQKYYKTEVNINSIKLGKWFKAKRQRNTSVINIAFHIPIKFKDVSFSFLTDGVADPKDDWVINSTSSKCENHNKGDFVVCTAVNGKPDFEAGVGPGIVNGSYFEYAYDTRAFKELKMSNILKLHKPVDLDINETAKIDNVQNQLTEWNNTDNIVGINNNKKKNKRKTNQKTKKSKKETNKNFGNTEKKLHTTKNPISRFFIGIMDFLDYFRDRARRI